MHRLLIAMPLPRNEISILPEKMEKTFLWVTSHKLYGPSLQEIDIPKTKKKTNKYLELSNISVLNKLTGRSTFKSRHVQTNIVTTHA